MEIQAAYAVPCFKRIPCIFFYMAGRILKFSAHPMNNLLRDLYEIISYFRCSI